MQKYILHHPIVFWWSIIAWFPCQVWWTGVNYHSTCFNSWWNARCSCAWDYIEFTTLFVKSESLFSCFCECVNVWGKIVDLLNVWFTFWTHDMYWHVWLIISWKGKVVFPLHSVFRVLRCKSPKKHIFHYYDIHRDMYGYLWIPNLLDLFDVQVVRWVSTHFCRSFWCRLSTVKLMNFKVVGDNWKLAKALVRAKIEDLCLPSFLITPPEV